MAYEREEFAVQEDFYDEEAGEWIGLRNCSGCGGEGCTDCDNTGVIYP